MEMLKIIFTIFFCLILNLIILNLNGRQQCVLYKSDDTNLATMEVDNCKEECNCKNAVNPRGVISSSAGCAYVLCTEAGQRIRGAL